MDERLTPFALFSLFLGSGLQIFGYTNPVIGIALLIASSVFLVVWVWGYINNRRKLKNLSPFVLDRSHFLAITQFFGTLSLGALALFAAEIFFEFSPLPEKLITVTVPPASHTLPLLPSPQQLVANNPPPISNDIAINASRYLLLEEATQKAETIRDSLEKNAQGVLANELRNIEMQQQIKDGKLDMFHQRNIIMHQVGYNYIFSWKNTVTELEDLNKKLYSNRPLDVTTTNELSIPTVVAPGEERFVGADEATSMKKYEFRKFYFLSRNVVKQANAFIEDIKKEKSIVAQGLEKSAEGRNFVIPKK
ncbi:hypothetical protein [Methylocystis sp. S23]